MMLEWSIVQAALGCRFIKGQNRLVQAGLNEGACGAIVGLRSSLMSKFPRVSAAFTCRG